MLGRRWWGNKYKNSLDGACVVQHRTYVLNPGGTKLPCEGHHSALLHVERVPQTDVHILSIAQTALRWVQKRAYCSEGAKIAHGLATDCLGLSIKMST